MVRDLYAPGSFNDATRYAWSSLPRIIKRWWPLYTVAIVCRVAPQYSASILLNDLGGLILGGVALISAALTFRGSRPDARAALAGLLWTFIIPTAAFGLLGLLLPRPPVISAELWLYFAGTLLAIWLYPKIIGAACISLLGNDRETALDAYAVAWRFISGNVWWRFFFISLLAAIPVAVISVVFLRVAPPNSSLLGLRYLALTIVALAGEVFTNSAMCAIVATVPHLRARYGEASENSAQ
ncbi:MAG TPA: hypothetical protein VF778_07695 [Xanthobacteraceae bacterium]